MLFDTLRDFQHAQLSRMWGKYAGKVVDNADPEKIGRLKVTCPEVFGNDQTAVWAMPCVPYAGKDVGFYFIPPVGAGIWVEFQAGDTSRPIWAGCYWAKGELPAEADSPDVKLIKTASATFKITDPAGEVLIENTSDASTTWSAEIVAEAGQAKHSIGASGITSESAASVGKVDVSDGGVTVNNGAFKVM